MRGQVAPSLEPFEGESVFVEANGIRHHLLAYGSRDSRPLLILPGITSPAPTWEFVAAPLSSHFRVFTLDIRGRGLSAVPESGYSLPEYAADAAGVIEALGLERPIILAHSMGARIAAALGAEYPGLVGPLVIVDPPLTGPGREPYSMSEEAFVTSIREAKAGAGPDEMRVYFPSWSDDQLRLRAEWLPTCDENAVAQTHRYFHTEDLFPYLRALGGPVVFVYGGDSPAVSREGAAEVSEAIPGAEILEIPGAGHMIPWDEFEAFMSALEPRLLAFPGA